MKERGASSYRELVRFVEDRPGHDRRYGIDPAKAESELGWHARTDFEAGLEATVRWFLENEDWCRAVSGDDVARRRLGLARS